MRKSIKALLTAAVISTSVIAMAGAASAATYLPQKTVSYIKKDGKWIKDSEETTYTYKGGKTVKEVEKYKKFDFQSFASAAFHGDTFTFGTWEQDGDTENGPEDIVWYVLSNRDGKLTAISKYGLDAQPYHSEASEVTWENSDIRSWLNTAFYETAFSEAERKLIDISQISNRENPYYATGGGGSTEDAVFLLSEKDAEALTADISVGYPTAAGRAAGISTDGTGHCEWWLRTTGIREGTACRVSKDGEADAIGTKIESDFLAVRPCIVIDYQ